MSKNILTSLVLFLLMGILPMQTSAQTIEKPKIIAINPGHFPTDKLGGTGTPGKDAKEYQLNLKMTEYISSEFKHDPRFEMILTKNNENFNEPLLTDVFNPAQIKYIQNKMKLKTPHVRGFTHQGNPTATPPKTLRTIYATRLVLEDKTDADLTLNLHHDYSAKEDSGHSVIISPYNKKYQETKDLALCVLEELSKEKNVSTQKNAPNDSIPDFPKYMQEDRMNFEYKGLRFRKLLPEIGNYQLPAKKPTILIEYNFAQKVSIHDDKYFKKMAQATHRAILKYYNLNIYESMDDKFTLILKNSKTGYTIKPEQNRISDFVMKEIFSGIKDKK